jgi:hypothetical protein
MTMEQSEKGDNLRKISLNKEFGFIAWGNHNYSLEEFRSLLFGDESPRTVNSPGS